jgi:hypothetical protein
MRPSALGFDHLQAPQITRGTPQPRPRRSSCRRDPFTPVITMHGTLKVRTIVLIKVIEARLPTPSQVLPQPPYQEFLTWGIYQELGSTRGGILVRVLQQLV